jgi:Ca2+-binding EF-hand superfamily protein
MLSEFQQRKLSYMFDAYDSDKNGYLEESDFAQVGQRFDQLLNLPHDQSSNWFLGFWQGLAQVAGPDGRVSRDAWLGFLDQMWSQPAVYEATIEAAVAFYFTALDANGDGLLSPAEYRIFFQAMNLDESLVDQIFPLMDDNHDGSISLAEYNQRVREFYGDDPQAPGNWLLGPLN